MALKSFWFIFNSEGADKGENDSVGILEQIKKELVFFGF